MMQYNKYVDDGYIASLSQSSAPGEGNITREDYDTIMAILPTAPEAPEGYAYRLSDSSLQWELVPAAEAELTDSEALNIMTGGTV